MNLTNCEWNRIQKLILILFPILLFFDVMPALADQQVPTSSMPGNIVQFDDFTKNSITGDITAAVQQETSYTYTDRNIKALGEPVTATITVLNPDGAPAVNANVQILTKYTWGYSSDIDGITDSSGKWVASISPTTDALGYIVMAQSKDYVDTSRTQLGVVQYRQLDSFADIVMDSSGLQEVDFNIPGMTRDSGELWVFLNPDGPGTKAFVYVNSSTPYLMFPSGSPTKMKALLQPGVYSFKYVNINYRADPTEYTYLLQQADVEISNSQPAAVSFNIDQTSIISLEAAEDFQNLRISIQNEPFNLSLGLPVAQVVSAGNQVGISGSAKLQGTSNNYWTYNFALDATKQLEAGESYSYSLGGNLALLIDAQQELDNLHPGDSILFNARAEDSFHNPLTYIAAFPPGGGQPLPVYLQAALVRDNDNITVDEVQWGYQNAYWGSPNYTVPADLPDGSYRLEFTLDAGPAGVLHYSSVHFPDPNLEVAVREALIKPTGDITTTDMAGLTSLVADHREINDLTGMENAVNLENLNLGYNQISNIDTLAGLVTLQSLNLGRNQLSDIAPIAGLSNLRSLFLGANQISDFSPLVNLTNLQALSLGGNQIGDLASIAAVLASKTNLQQLYLWDNQLSDISLLADMTSLQEIVLAENQISDLTPLANLTQLQKLRISNNEISDLTALQSLADLQQLLIDHNNINDITPLTNLTNLQELNLGDNQITSISPLVQNGGLSSGDYVNLKNNYLDLAPDSQAMADIQLLLGNGVAVDYTPQLQSIGTISGIVTDAAGTTLEGISVEAGGIDVETDPDGNYTIGLPYGTYKVFAPSRERWGTNDGDWAREKYSTDVTIDAIHPEVTGIDFILKPGGSISGRITDSSGDGVANAYVWAELKIGADSWVKVSNATTDSDGYYILRGLANGEYKVGAETEGVDPMYYPGTQDRRNAQVLTVTEPDNLANIDWKIAVIVHFNDPNLEAVVREALGKPTGDISATDMANLTYLNAVNWGISDLTGLEYASNLAQLSLLENQITDVSQLAELTSLRTLGLDNNQISDITPLTGLHNLRALYIGHNNFDGTKLQNITQWFPQLENLDFSGNNVTDISTLSSMTYLQSLYLNGNQITDISSLSFLTNLQNLDLSHNRITDISALVTNRNSGGFTSQEPWEKINIHHNYLDFAAGSPAMDDIQYLIANGVAVEYQPQWRMVDHPEQPVEFPDPNLEAAIRDALGQYTGNITRGDLAGLTEFEPIGRGIFDITGLEYAVNLESLWLKINSVTDLSPLSCLTNLRELWLWENYVTDLSALSNLTALQRLQLGGNQISDISPLAGLSNLQFLGLGWNRINDLTPLIVLTGLQELNLSENQISDITALTNLTNLTSLELEGNRITDISPLVSNSNYGGFLGNYNRISLSKNFLNLTDGSPAMADIQTLLDRGENVEYEPQRLIVQNPELPVEFPDPNLEVSVRAALGKKSGTITRGDIAGSSSLNAYGKGIINLTGLEYAVNLEELRLGDNQINDLTPLAGLTRLSNLNLYRNQITDISALAGLTSLQYLSLGNNQISNISSLTSLTLLRDLYLYRNQITNIVPLVTNDGLGSGDNVYLGENYLDLSAGSQAMVDIQTLQIRGVNVTYQPQHKAVANQVSVAIDNSVNARPQSGLDQADIVYETAVAPGITRYLAIFDLAKPVDKIGPVRSAREHLLGLAAGHGGGFAHAGGDSYSLAVLPGVPVVNLDEIYGSGTYFYRDTDRAMPHNLYTSSSLLQQGLAANSQLLVEPDDPFSRGEMIGGASAAAATVRYPGQSQDTIFQWNAAGQNYQLIVDGQPDLMDNNAPITAANVVVLYTDHRQEYHSNLGEWTIKARMEGTGEALFYRDGKVWSGQWTRADRDAKFEFSVDGNPMQFAPGNVWVLITTIPGQQTVYFPDHRLDAAVRNALGRPRWDLTTADLNRLTYLNASGRSIQDLTGLNRAVNLQYLDLSDNNINDISPLLNAGFSSGVTIDLRSNYLDLAESGMMDAIMTLVANGITVLYQPQLGGVSGQLQLQAKVAQSGLMTTLDIADGGGGGPGPAPTPGGGGGVPPTPVVSTPMPWIAVTLYGNSAGGPAYSTRADIDGNFNLPRVEAGSYTLVTSYPGYLATTRQVTVDAAATTDLGPVQLLTGDLDSNHRIGAQDLKLLARSYGKGLASATWNDRQADFNADGRVDLYDMALLARNYEQSALPGTGEDSSLAQALVAGRLITLGIIEGDLDGKLRPGATVTRAEFAVIAAILAGLKDEVGQYKQVQSPFSDVQDNAWYSYWIKAAAAHGLLKGYPDGTFNPDGGVTNAEVITVLLRLLGYNDNLPGNWPSDYVTKAAELGLTTGLTLPVTAPAARREVFIMANTLLDQQKVNHDPTTGNFNPAGMRLVEELLGM